ncbi:MAG: YXWGXW repeat-containing protein [Proteobacteria bacterium]|nr:YXWGXW repeat-containing protein [Pseudomonadota bacterium]MDA0981679.1 YXWGXW repeat-containing protein [Pseudomonadota bacterium]
MRNSDHHLDVPAERTALRQLALSSAASLAFADLSVRIGIGVPLPPPAPMLEVALVQACSYVWAPGYWARNHDRHIWICGRHVVAVPFSFCAAKLCTCA